ncbi:PREDICTED: uncharacterized protein LOC107333211 [Acropora digitifera]|uniref:uncharacterized protein LOC107333211 n=1 Tax=Acropora digitifera TaxID=70779 RepID=UPI00077A77AE|nr:PREDICTED: uncharacterized protein LOC107333211 [Acropora digitifera]
MALKTVLLKWLSVLNVAHGILVIILGIASLNVTDLYEGLFGMGIWLGGLMLLTGLAGLSSASHVGNRSRLKFFFSCNVITIITMITCNIIIGTVAITHFQYESTVGKDYHNQNNQDHFKAEEEFKARNVAGKTGLTVYGIVMVVITSDVFLNAALVMISRDLFQKYADLFPERINNGAGQMSEPMEVCDFQQEPPPAYSPRIQSCSPHSSLPGAIFHVF